MEGNDLKSLKNIKIHYTRGIENPLEDFLIPCLNKSIEYNLITGFFSSRLIKKIFYKIEEFVKNNGTIQILSGWMYPEDLKISELNQEKLKKYIEKEINNLIDEFDKLNLLDHKKLLAYLIYHKKLKIKIGTPVDNFGRPSILYNHLLHEKIGYFKDENNNIISYSGSINTTPSAWFENREEFKVFNNWEEIKKDYCAVDIKKFNRYWHCLDPGLFIYDIDKIPENIKRKLFNFKPESLKEIQFSNLNDYNNLSQTDEIVKTYQKNGWLFYEEGLIPRIELLKLRSCQIDAIESLEKNDYCNILAMATGSGKTLAAIRAVYEIIKMNDFQRFLIIVNVPDLYLVAQWTKELKYYTNEILEIHSGNPDWKEDYTTILQSLSENIEEIHHCFFIGTQDSLKRNVFNEILKYIRPENIIFIGDEAHSLGAPISKYNIENFHPKYRVGLTATPTRKFDEEGTNFLFQWFKTNEKNYFTYTLKQGQEDNYLENFHYYFEICYLSDSNFEDYKEISSKLHKFIHTNTEEARKTATNMLSQRASILKTEENKFEKCATILIKLIEQGKLERTVIYCYDTNHLHQVEEQLRHIKEIHKPDLVWQTIIGSESSLDQRKIFIDALESGRIDLLLAIKCLDQGVDIPTLERAIFLASSGSEREHIQRSGRILRKVKGFVKNVEIYDILVLSTENQLKDNYTLAQHIIDIEKERAYFFAEFSENYEEATLKLLNL